MSEMKDDWGEEKSKEWVIPKERELRFEAGEEEITIVLVEGIAEFFGTELAPCMEYKFVQQKGAIFTYKDGCVVRVTGTPAHIYLATETPMIKYCNLNAALERLRNSAKQANKRGPRVLVCGPQDSGKSTLCRILLNYAFRASWMPMFVDVDVGQNAITIPGALAATPLTAPFDVEKGLTVKNELALFFGHNTPAKATQFYKTLCERLARLVNERLESQDSERPSGIIINTCGWVEEGGYSLLLEVAKIFEIDVMVVLEERLAEKLKVDKQLEERISVVHLEKSGGVVARSQKERRAHQQAAFHEYFYGPGPGKPLCPHNQSRRFNDLSCFRVGGGAMAPSAALPLGTTARLDPNRLEPLELSTTDVINSIVGVSFAEKSHTMAEEPIAGFARVTERDNKEQSLILLTPAPELPSCTLFLGSLKWTEG
jgi:polyribonucleotide 5'-hydroxyl-kinase